MVDLAWSVVSFFSLNGFESSFAMVLHESPQVGDVAPKNLQLLRVWAGHFDIVRNALPSSTSARAVRATSARVQQLWWCEVRSASVCASYEFGLHVLPAGTWRGVRSSTWPPRERRDGGKCVWPRLALEVCTRFSIRPREGESADILDFTMMLRETVTVTVIFSCVRHCRSCWAPTLPRQPRSQGFTGLCPGGHPGLEAVARRRRVHQSQDSN